MSLLLDALKKAAQEKLEKQNQSEQPIREESNSPIPAQRAEPVQAPLQTDYSRDSPDSGQPAGADNFQGKDDDEVLELEPLEDEELSIDADAFSDTDYQYRRSAVLASELRAFNSDTDSAAGTGPPTGKWNIEPLDTLYPSTPRQAEQIFSSKNSGNNRQGLLLLTGGVLLAVLLAGAVFAYHYLTNADDNLVVIKSEPQPLPAAVTQSAETEVDATLLIEQEDYDSLLANDLGETERSSTGSAAADRTAEGADAYQSPASPETKTATSGAALTRRQTAAGEEKLNISRTTGRESLQDVLMRGYTAYNKGEFENAEIAYRQALTRAPDSRDAMLGMAAVRYAQGDAQAAAAYYRKLLQRDPKDELALAALAGIEDAAGSAFPKAGLSEESHIKLMLEEKPDSDYLHFTLGNIYADSRRWAEAQQAYFNAYRLQPENPDYAFNLAVSLDHLGKKSEAAHYYRQSLTLAHERKPNFDTQSAVARLDSLQEL